MPSNHIRFDNLPMNRQVGNPGMADAGKSSPLSGGATLPAVYEKRDIDPESLFLKRRKGSVRSATATPNLLGVTVDVNEGEVYIDEDFSGDLTADKWSLICTIRITAGATQNAVYPIARLQAMQAQIEYDQESALYSLVWRSTVTPNTALQTLPLGAAGDYRIAMGRLTASSRLAKWNLDNTGYVHNTVSNSAWFDTESTLRLLGPIVGTTLATLEEVVVTNFQFYDQTEFTESDYKAFAADLTPATSGTTLGETVINSTNLIDPETDWTVGSGDVNGWIAEGSANENNRESRSNPHGDTDIIWVGSDEDNTNAFDGGFKTPVFTVDPTKTYRLTVWVKTDTASGSLLWGFGNGQRVDLNGNPQNYLDAGRDLPTQGDWYLFVGFVHPYTYTGVEDDDTGVYSTSGTQYLHNEVDDLRWNDAADTSAQLRIACYSNPSAAGDEALFWDPRFEVVDGSETPLSQLLNPTSGLSNMDYKLLWHENFSEGGDVFAYTNSDTETIASYLVPTNPTVDGDEITFGGGGIIEVPFYLDFDEYYWTPINASARYEWMFQLELKLPNRPLQAGVVFEFQDICRLEIIENSGSYYFKAFYANSGELQNTQALTSGGHYNVFAGRDVQNMKLGVQPIGGALTSVTSSAPFPAVFNYDQTLSFIIGDRVDVENTAPFKGRIIRFALHNNADYAFSGLGDAVVYYDSSSVYGDQIIDRGNRALNSYLGTRMSSAPPFYMQGGFPGGSYVAATGGYLMSSSSPSDGYSGELRKSIKKDAVVQRRGNKSFLTSNGVSYVIDDFDQTFRPLGIPRPGTKVTCLPQGVGPIDGFVRYAYRFVTKDGTVGPAFDLDPVDARGGVNVFLGAESFGLPGETPFGISYGRCEGYDEDPTKGLASTETVEHFLFRDTDGSSQHNLTYGDLDGKGRTLELAVRFSEFDKFRESVFSQGVTYLAPGQTSTSYQRVMGCYNAGKQFPWLAQSQKECCFQFAFRYSSAPSHQILFRVGANDQHYETGSWLSGDEDHYRLNQLVVSVQPSTDYPGAQSGDNLLVVCRDAPSGGNHRDNDLYQQAFLYNFQDGHDYCVFVRRAGNYVGQPTGTSLRVHVYDHTVAQAGGNGWAWTDGSGDTEKVFNNFWPTGYSGAHPGRRHVGWGMGRLQDSWTGYRTRIWNGGLSWDGSAWVYVWAWRFQNMKGLHEASVLYHGRMWRRDFPFTLLANKGLERYAARNGPLSEGLEVDIGFCRDTSKTQNEYGWDAHNELACPFKASNGTNVEPYVVITDSGNATPCLAYGWDMAKPAGSWSTDERSKIPLWMEITDRNDGSLAIGTGKEVAVEISSRKWWQGAETQTFDEFAGVIDLEEFTWITLYFHQYQRPGTTEDILDLYLERVFIDGNTGEWGETFSGDPATPLNKNPEPSKGPYQYGLFTVGGFPALDQKYDVDIAEVRMWDGERYSAEGGGEGDETFGPYLSTRVPPNEWDKLIYYARFMKPDLDDEDTPTTMDQVGTFEFPGGFKQQGADAVYVRQGASVLDALDDSDSTTTQYFVPFPEPPESSIRGIQIFRTQIVPVVDDFASGQPNPDAVSDAWRACRDAPLYFLSEIPRGNTSYTDTSSDGILGSQLEATTGLVPRNPGGIFEWKGYLGIFDTTQPRVYFAESPASWESFPLENLYDLPVREDGPIRAAIELASRDARNSRVLLLGKSYGVFLDGTPLQPVANTMGGGVGAWSQRCLVVEKGIAYAYNGTLWAITGDGQAEDIGLPVLDLLPPPDSARLSVSSSLGSLFVINEETGIALRFHFARRQWYVEDRSALSCTDVDGVDQWVHRSGYPSAGSASVYQDDVVADTPATKVVVSSWDNAANTVTLASATGVEVGMRMTLVNDRQTGSIRLNPAIRQTVTVASIAGNVVTVEEDLDIQSSWTDVHGDTHSVRLHAYLGVGYWGTMIDTGPFKLRGDLKYVDVGVDAGDDWWGAVQGSDYPADPANRSGFVDAESAPTSIVDEGGSGVSTRLGVNNNQRYERVLFWSPVGQAVGLTELELSYTTDPGEDR